MEKNSTFKPTKNTVKRQVYITGLTAIGKTKLSIALAKHLNTGEIINSDSQQFYKNADIMTATASMEEREGVKHHLLSFLPTTETDFNVNKFVEEAKHILTDLEKRMVQNVIVGGTNYYTESLIYSRTNETGTKNINEDSHLDENNLKKRKLNDLQISTLNQLLEENNFDNMMSFYQTIEPERSKLIHQNDIRKLENTLRRLLIHDDPSYTWKFKDKDFLILALDTSNTTWLESRISKRIKEMVCEEGGLEETYQLFFTNIIYYLDQETKFKRETLLKDQLIEYFEEMSSVCESLSTKTSHGVLQAIGYKEFIKLFQNSFKMVLNDQLSQFLSRNEPHVKSKLNQEIKEALISQAKELTGKYDQMKSLKYSIYNLTKNTIRLTKKQRKWIKNRIQTNPNMLEKCFFFNVSSKEQFINEIIPKSKDILMNFLTSDNASLAILESKSKYPELCRELREKNKKIVFECDICERRIIGEIEKKRHLKSKNHKLKQKKLKLKKTSNLIRDIQNN